MTPLEQDGGLQLFWVQHPYSWRDFDLVKMPLWQELLYLLSQQFPAGYGSTCLLISALKVEDCGLQSQHREFQVSLNHIARPCLKRWVLRR